MNSLPYEPRALSMAWGEYVPDVEPGYQVRPTGRLNHALRAELAKRWGHTSRGTAPIPERLAVRELLGVKKIALGASRIQPDAGYVVNLQFVYRGTQPQPYLLEIVAFGYPEGPLTGEAWARECTCPDFTKRRGPGRDQLQGEARCCKHMILALWVAQSWRHRWPWCGIVTPKAYLGKGMLPNIRETLRLGASIAERRQLAADMAADPEYAARVVTEEEIAALSLPAGAPIVSPWAEEEATEAA